MSKQVPRHRGRTIGYRQSLTADGRIDAAITLLCALTSADGGTIPVEDACRELSLDKPQLEEVVEEIQGLSDEATGARALVGIEDGEVVMTGESSQLHGLRFTPDEAAAVMLVVDRYRLPEGARERLKRALMPTDGKVKVGNRLSGDPLFGDFYPELVDALACGIRIDMGYRSAGDTGARVRTVDPLYIDVAGDSAYLIAWDVSQDIQKRYRLDRVCSVAFTDDSVAHHAYVRETPAESIGKIGSRARLRFSNQAAFTRCDWAGIDREGAQTNDDRSVTANVSYTDREWLFDNVLSGGGAVIIEEPEHLREEFISYGRFVLSSIP